MTQARPKSRRAVIYNQDELYDFANSGGSMCALLEEELREGNRIIIVQEPNDGRTVVVMVLEKPEDISLWENYRKKMHDWRRYILGQQSVEENGNSSAMAHRQGAHQMPGCDRQRSAA